jgi:hypothetical protein
MEGKKDRFDLGASPQAPGIYRVWTREEIEEKDGGFSGPHLFPGLSRALGSLPSVALSSLENVKTECLVQPLAFLPEPLC